MSEIPSIYALEPVYTSTDSTESSWVECELRWVEERQAFVNYDSDPDWILDEHAYPDSEYRVDGDDNTYNSLDEAVEAALSESELSREDVSVIPTVRE